jgi:hypothetical protein
MRAPRPQALVEEPTLRIVLVVMKRGARLREHDADGPVSVHTLADLLRLHLPTQSADLPAGHLLTGRPAQRAVRASAHRGVLAATGGVGPPLDQIPRQDFRLGRVRLEMVPTVA